MKTSNKLFVICTIYVPIMLIALLYPQIHDFYTYSVPLNDFAIERWMYSQPDYLSSIQNKEDTTCFTAPSKHLFCYGKPRMYENGGTSFIKALIRTVFLRLREFQLILFCKGKRCFHGNILGL